MKTKSKEITLSVEKKERKKNPPRTVFREGNPYRVQPGQVLNPRGGRPKNEHRLTSKALVVDLARRAAPNITRALGLPTHASYAQCLSRSLIRRALAGDTQCAALILSYTEGLPKNHVTLVDETAEQPSRFEILFMDSDGDGHPVRECQKTIDGRLADEPKGLPEPD